MNFGLRSSNYTFGIKELDHDIQINTGDLILLKEDMYSTNHMIFNKVFCSANSISSVYSSDYTTVDIPLKKEGGSEIYHKKNIIAWRYSTSPTNKKYTYFDLGECERSVLCTSHFTLPSKDFVGLSLFSPAFCEENKLSEGGIEIFLYKLRRECQLKGVVGFISVPTYLYGDIKWPLYFDKVFSLELYGHYNGILKVERGGINKLYGFKVTSSGIHMENINTPPESLKPKKNVLTEF